MKCVVCGKAVAVGTAPVCSSRCQQVDLNRWLSGSYRVPTNEVPEAGAEGEFAEK